MISNVHIENHPENGDYSYVVLFEMNGRELWFAHSSQEDADAHVKRLVSKQN